MRLRDLRYLGVLVVVASAACASEPASERQWAVNYKCAAETTVQTVIVIGRGPLSAVEAARPHIERACDTVSPIGYRIGSAEPVVMPTVEIASEPVTR